MRVQIITPEKSLYDGEAQSVTVPSMDGPFTMLKHHAAIVAILIAGKVTLTDLQGEKQVFEINGGFCEQHEDIVIICVEKEEGRRKKEEVRI